MSISTEINNEIKRISTAKAAIKTAIESKGVTVPDTAKIDDYATYINSIPTGSGGSAELYEHNIYLAGDNNDYFTTYTYVAYFTAYTTTGTEISDMNTLLKILQERSRKAYNVLNIPATGVIADTDMNIQGIITNMSVDGNNAFYSLLGYFVRANESFSLDLSVDDPSVEDCVVRII